MGFFESLGLSMPEEEAPILPPLRERSPYGDPMAATADLGLNQQPVSPDPNPPNPPGLMRGALLPSLPEMPDLSQYARGALLPGAPAAAAVPPPAVVAAHEPLPDIVAGAGAGPAPKLVPAHTPAPAALPQMMPAHDPDNPLAVPDVRPDSHIRFQRLDPVTKQPIEGMTEYTGAPVEGGKGGGVVTADLAAMGPEQRLDHDAALAEDAKLRVLTEQGRQALAELRNPFSDASRRSMTAQYQAAQAQRRLQTFSQAMAYHESIASDPRRSPQEREESAAKLRMYQSLYNREKEQAQLTLPAYAGRSLGYFDPRYPAMPAGVAPATPEEK